MKKYLSILLLALVLIGCNDNESYREANYNASDIIGEWVLLEEQNKSYIQNLAFHNNSTMESSIYRYPSASNYLAKYGSGIWSYSRDTHNLESRAIYNDSQQNKTNFYNVSHVDAYTLLMYDKQLHSLDTYIRVAGNYTLFMLNKQSIDCLPENFHAKSYESINKDIATVDENGTVAGVGIGTTFILAKDKDKTLAIKINVENGVKRHAKEVNTNIMSIIKKYGSHYFYKDDLNYGLNIVAYTNPEYEPCASEVQYHYDPYSGSIVCIEVLYNSETALKSDENYLGLYYYHLLLPPNTLHVEAGITNFFDSTYYIMELTNGLRYGSTGFLEGFHYANAWGYQIPGLFND